MENRLTGVRVILASRSPRRRELLTSLCESFEIMTEEVDESLPDGVHPRDGVRVLAERKGEAVRKNVGGGALILSSDTLVEIDGEPLGKPRDESDAFIMLRRLSGRTHRVHTGVAVHYQDRLYSGTATSSVTFRELSDREILDYIATGEPMDKAGSYGIQGKGGALVASFRGDMDTVIGLSMRLTRELIGAALDGADK